MSICGGTASFTNLSGGNLVDGLPLACIYGIRRDFSILLLRFIWSGNFILAIIIFGRFSIYEKGFVKYELLVTSQCRERAEGSSEMMNNIWGENNDICLENIFHKRSIQ